MKFYSVSEKRKIACQAAMTTAGFDVEFLWDRVVANKGNIRATVNCKHCGFHTNRSLSDLQKGKFFCYGCHHKELEAVSERCNFKLNNFDSKYCHLQCKTCKTGKKVVKSALYTTRLICQTCLENKYKLTSANQGFNLLSRSDGGQVFHLLCTTCNAERVANMSSVLAGEVRCKTCADTAKLEVMNPSDFRILSLTDTSTVVLECTHCGYWKASTYFTIKSNRLACINCRKIKYENALERRGCKLLSYEKGRIDFISPSGEKLTTNPSSLVSGKFATTSDNRWNVSTAVYVILCHSGETIYCKIGTAIDPENRLRELKLTGETSVVELARFDSRYDADKAEKWLHKYLSDYKVSPEKAKEFSNRVIRGDKIDGINEWFTVHSIHKIRKLLWH